MPQWLKKIIDFLLSIFHITTGIPKTPGELPAQSDPSAPEAPVLPHYRKSRSLMTFQERKFYQVVLREELGSQYTIFSKVRLGDLIWIDNEPKDNKNFSNQLRCKHIDFVICTKSGLEPVLALELDDSSHLRYDSYESDELKNRVCAQAGLPLLRVKVVQSYSSASIAGDIHAMIREAATKQSAPSTDQP